MKHTLYLLITLLTINLTSQEIQWEKTFGGMHADYLFDAMPTLDYGFIMVGGSLSNNTGDVGKNEGDFDYFITKVSEYGNLEWTSTLGGKKSDIIKNIISTNDGGYLVSGISNSGKQNNKTTVNIGQQDIWMVKVNIEGAIAWQKTLGGLANEDVLDVIKTKDGGYLIAGTSASDGTYYNKSLIAATDLVLKKGKNKGNLDYWLVKLDMEGDLIWQQTFGGKYKDQLQKIIELPSGNIVLGGTSNSPMGFDKRTINKGLNDWWILKLNKKGNTIWQKSFGADGDDQLFSMLLTKDEQLLLGGHFRSSLGADFAIIKLDLDGDIIWESTFSESTNDVLTDIVSNTDGTFLLSGYSASVSNFKNKKTTSKLKSITPKKGTEDYIVLKIDAAGEELWRKHLGTDKKEVLRKSIQTRDGGYVLMGSSMPIKAIKANDANFWIVKLLDKDKPVYKKEPLESIPNPTPNYTSVVIGEDYKEGTVLVSDYSGHTLQNFKIEGKRIVPVNLSNYADGVYIISVKTDVETNSVKVIKVAK